MSNDFPAKCFDVLIRIDVVPRTSKRLAPTAYPHHEPFKVLIERPERRRTVVERSEINAEHDTGDN